ncbi:MAG: hypothetical protein Q8K68_09335 [Nitrospirota bacterium]|nr:hypothetical protein [Nitrospirota bacterium]
MGDEKVVLRFLDGAILKGHIRDFSEMSDELAFQEPGSDAVRVIKNDLLKAIFFVRTFEGNSQYSEKKSYGIRKPRGHRTFIKFIDGEDLVGFLEGELPWKKGFFLSRNTINDLKGFFVLPADEGSNNVRIFIYAHAVKDVTVVP